MKDLEAAGVEETQYIVPTNTGDLGKFAMKYVVDNYTGTPALTLDEVQCTPTSTTPGDNTVVTCVVKDKASIPNTLATLTFTCVTAKAGKGETTVSADNTGLIKRDLEGHKYYTYTYTDNSVDPAVTREVDLTAQDPKQFIPWAKASIAAAGAANVVDENCEVKYSANGTAYSTFTTAGATDLTQVDANNAVTTKVQVTLMGSDPTAAPIATVVFSLKEEAPAYIWSSESDKLTVTNVGNTPLDIKVGVKPTMSTGLTMAVKSADGTTAAQNLAAADVDSGKPTIMLTLKTEATRKYTPADTANNTPASWTSSSLSTDLTSPSGVTNVTTKVAGSPDEAFQTVWLAEKNKYDYGYSAVSRAEHAYLMDNTKPNPADDDPNYVSYFGTLDVSFVGDCNGYHMGGKLADEWDKLAAATTAVQPKLELTWEITPHPTDTAPTLTDPAAMTFTLNKTATLPISFGKGDWKPTAIVSVTFTHPTDGSKTATLSVDNSGTSVKLTQDILDAMRTVMDANGKTKMTVNATVLAAIDTAQGTSGYNDKGEAFFKEADSASDLDVIKNAEVTFTIK